MNLYQRNLNRLKGFSDGAGSRPMEPQMQNDEDYSLGYIDGQKAKRTYADQSHFYYGVPIHAVVPLSTELPHPV